MSSKRDEIEGAENEALSLVSSPSRHSLLDSSISDLRNDLHSLKNQKSELLMSEEDLEEENITIKKELDTLKQDLELAHSEIGDLQSRNAALLAESSSLKIESAAAQSEIANLKSEIEKNNASFEKIKNNYNSSMDEMKGKLRAEMIKLIEANKNLKSELNEALATIEDLDQQLSESESMRQANADKLHDNTVVKALNDEVDTLKRELSDQKTKYEKLQDELLLNQRESLQLQNKLLGELSALRTQMTQKEEDHVRVAASLQEQISNTVAEHNQILSDKQAEHQAIVQALNSERSDLAALLADAKNQCSELRRELDAAEIRQLELESAVDAAQSESTAIQESLEDANLLIATKTREIEQLQIRLAETTDHHSELLTSHKEVAMVQSQMLNDFTEKNSQLHQIITSYELQLSSTLGMVEEDELQKSRLIAELRAEIAAAQQGTRDVQSELEAVKLDHEQKVGDLNKSIEKLTALSGEYLDDHYAAEKEAESLRNQLCSLQQTMQEEAEEAKNTLKERSRELSDRIAELERVVEEERASHVAVVIEKELRHQTLLKSASDKADETLSTAQKRLEDALAELFNLRRECNRALSHLNAQVATTKAERASTVSALTLRHESREAMLSEDSRRREVLLNQSIADLQRMNSDLNADNVQLRESVSQLSGEVEQLRLAELQLNEKNDEFLTLTSTLDEDLTAAKEKVALLEETLSVSLSELKRAQQEDEADRLQLEEKLRDSQAVVSALELQLSSIRSMWDDEQSRRLNLAVTAQSNAEEQLKQTQLEVERLSEAQTTLQEELSQVKASEESLKSESKTLSEQLSTAQQQIADLTKSNEKLTTLSGEYLDDSYTAEKEAESLRNQLCSLQQTMQEEAEEAKNTLKERSRELSDRIAELERVVEEERASHVAVVIEKELRHQSLVKTAYDSLNETQLTLERSQHESEDRRKQLFDATVKLEDLTDQVKQLSAKNVELEAELKAKETEILSLKDKNEKLLTMSAECQDEALVLQKEWDAEKKLLNGEKESLQMELTSVQQQLADLKQTSESKLSETQAQHELALAEQLCRLDEVTKELEAAKQSLRSEESKYFDLEHEFNEVSAEKEQLGKEVISLRGSVKELQLRLEESELEAEAYRGKNEKLLTISKGLQEELLNMTQRGDQAIGSLTQENQLLKESLQLAVSENERLTGSQKDLSSQLSTSVAQIQEKDSQLESNSLRIQELDGDLKRVTNELTETKRQLTVKSEDSSALQLRLSESEQQREEVSRTKQALEDDLARVSLALATAVKESQLLQGDLDAVQGQVMQMTKESEVTRKIIDKLRSDLSQVQSQLSEKTAELSQLTQKCSTLEESKSALTSSLSETEKALEDHKTMLQDASEAAVRMQEVLDESKEGQAKELEKTRAELNLLLVEKQQMLSALGDELAEALHKLKNTEVAGESFKKALASKSQECDELAVKYEKLVAVSADYQDELLEANREVERLQSDLEAVEQASETLRLSLKEKFAAATEEWTKLMNDGNKKAAAKETQIFALNKQVEELTASSAAKAKQYDALKARLVEVEAAASQSKALSGELALIKKQYKEKLNECDTLKEKISEQEALMKELSKSHNNEMVHLRNQLKDLQAASSTSSPLTPANGSRPAAGSSGAGSTGKGFTTVKLQADTVNFGPGGVPASSGYGGESGSSPGQFQLNTVYTPKTSGPSASSSSASAGDANGSNNKKKVVIPSLELLPPNGNGVYTPAASSVDPPALIQSLQNSSDITVAGLSSLLNKNSDQLSPNIVKSHDLRSPVAFTPKVSSHVLSPDASSRLPASAMNNAAMLGASGMKSPRLKSQVTPRTTATSAYQTPGHHQQQQQYHHHHNPSHTTPAAHSVHHNAPGSGAHHAILAETPNKGGVPFVYEGGAATYSNNFNRLKSAAAASNKAR